MSSMSVFFLQSVQFFELILRNLSFFYQLLADFRQQQIVFQRQQRILMLLPFMLFLQEDIVL